MEIFKNRKERIDSFFQNRKKTIEKKEIPDYVFKPCPSCQNNIVYEDLLKNYYVCPICGHHFKISAHERIRELCDEDSFEEMNYDWKTKNIGNFKGYDEKLEKAQASTGLHEAVICGIGKIEGLHCAIGVMDSNFMMASMGRVVGEKITRLIEYANENHYPLLLVCASGGARMQEGIYSLVQMAKTSSALKQFRGLYISLLTHPTTGGVSASFAMLGDIILAEPGSLIGFAGRRVIEKTINEKLPANFQSAEFTEEKGFIDTIVTRKDLRETIAKIIRLHGGISK